MKIGDFLYRYCDGRGVWRYVIVGILESASGKSFILSCDTCPIGSAGWRIYINSETMRYEKSEMVDPEEYPEVDSWHKRESYVYHQKREDALKDMYTYLIGAQESAITKALNNIESAKENIAKWQKARELDLKDNNGL